MSEMLGRLVIRWNSSKNYYQTLCCDQLRLENTLIQLKWTSSFNFTKFELPFKCAHCISFYAVNMQSILREWKDP